MGSYPYGHRYRKLRAGMLGQPCELLLTDECVDAGGAPAESADHTPPLSRHEHWEGSGCCVLRPACMPCQHEQARLLSMETKRMRRMMVVGPSIEYGTDGLIQSVEWL